MQLNSDRLYCAVGLGDIAEVDRRLARGGNIQTVSADGHTLLHCACKHGHVEIVSLLIAKGADIWVKNDHGDTPFHLACLYGHIEVVRSWPDCSEYYPIKNSDGQIPLYYACREGHLEIVRSRLSEFIEDRVKFCQMGPLQRNRLAYETIDAKDYWGNTPLHIACDRGRLEIAKELILAGANRYVLNKNGRSPTQMTSNDKILSLFVPQAKSAI